ncbi:hypothetical protein DFH11DRAFT_916633 [Phellopilus nigrolimitatus]|nr:hypothetical protein DFH11DRAFT_916633 [Phellopilus nigrolimitatus]
MGAPPGAPAAIDAAPRTRANTVTLNTHNMTHEHYHHHGHAHRREELTPPCPPGEFTHTRACTPASACRDVCRRGRHDCGSCADLACSQRRGRVESRVSRSSGTRCLTLLLPSPVVPALDVPRLPDDDLDSLEPSTACPCLPSPLCPRRRPPLGLNHLHDDNDEHSDERARPGWPASSSRPLRRRSHSFPRLWPQARWRCAGRPLLSRDEDQSVDQSMSDSSVPVFDALAHGFTCSTVSVIAGSRGSFASPKPLHSNSTSSPFLNHAAQLAAARAPFQLALLLSSALADADALRRELTVAQSHATRAERFLASVQGLPSRVPPAQMWTEKREREKDVKAESKVPGSVVEAVSDAEARADRAECAHVDIAASLQSVCAVHRGRTVRARVLAPLRRRAHRFCAPPLDGVAHRGIPQLPDRRFSQEPAFSARTKGRFSRSAFSSRAARHRRPVLRK